MKRAARRGALVALAWLLAWPPGADAQADQPDDTAMSAHKVASRLYQERNFKKAAEFYLTAYQMDPRPEFLFNAARSEQRAMMLDEAEKHFRECLALPRLTDELRKRATTHLDEIADMRQALEAARSQGKPAPAPPAVIEAPVGEKPEAPDPEPQPLVEKPAPTPAPAPAPAITPGPSPVTVAARAEAGGAWRRTTGWASLGVGAAALVLGGIQGLRYLSEQGSIDEATSRKDADGLITDIPWSSYERRQTNNWTRGTQGALGLGIGAVLCGAGAWLVLSAPTAPVAVLPGPAGVTLLARF